MIVPGGFTSLSETPPWVRAAGTAAIFFAVLFALSWTAAFGPLPLPGPQRLWDVAAEANVWTWGNAAVFVTGANACAFRAARPGTPRRAASGWAILCLLCLALSLDDVADFHTQLSGLGTQMGGGQGLAHFAWVIPGLGLGLAFLLVTGASAVLLGGTAGRLALAGGVTMLVGALGFEGISGAYLSGGGDNRRYAMLYHLEEAIEAAAAVLLLAAPFAARRAERAHARP